MYFLAINLILAVGGILLVARIWSEKQSDNNNLNTDCQAVLFSRFSKFLGIPVEILGLIFYIVVLLGSVAIFLFPIHNIAFYLLGLTFFTLISFIFSTYLMFIQTFVIKEWCLWCVNTFVLSVLVFLSTILEFAKLQINPAELINLNPSIVFVIYLITVSLGVATSILLFGSALRFLKDFRISAEEDRKLLVVDNILLITLVSAFFSNISLINTSLYSVGINISLGLIVVVGINYILLNLWVYPKLVGLRLNFSSISVLKTLILRQIALALSVISIVSWIFIFIFSTFIRIGDPVILISKYISYIVVALIFSQIFPFVVDKMGRKK